MVASFARAGAGTEQRAFLHVVREWKGGARTGTTSACIETSVRQSTPWPLVRLVALGVILAAAVGVAVMESPSLAGVRHAVNGSGTLGPALFVAIDVALTVALVPGTALTLASGALFGPVYGTIYAVVGATIGATAAFLIGRALGRDGVRKLLGPRTPRIENALEHTGFGAMLVLRLLPVVPFNGLNYAAGVTGIAARSYVAATILGILPGTAAVASAGSSVTDPTSPQFLASLGAGVLILAGSLVLHRRSVRVNERSGRVK